MMGVMIVAPAYMREQRVGSPVKPAYMLVFPVIIIHFQIMVEKQAV